MGWEPIQLFDRLVVVLFGQLRKRGHGSIEEVDRKIGQKPDYLRSVCRPSRRSIGVVKLLEVLKVLGLHPVYFIRLVFADDPESVAEAETDPIEAFGAGATAFRWTGVVGGLARKLDRFETETPYVSLGAEQQERLEQLDALRYEDHKAALQPAIRLCRGALKRGDLELAVRTAGILGSTLRMAVDLKGAQAVLWGAFRAARRYGLATAQADLLQRMVYVSADRGNRLLGLGLAERAALLYADLGDLVRLGQTQVDRGIMMLHLERYRTAARSLHAALRYLPNNQKRHRFSAMHGEAMAYFGLGELEQADAILRHAEPELPPGRHYEGRLFWLRAAMAAHCGGAHEAEALYRRTLAIFGSAFPGDAAIASIELVHLLLAQQRFEEAQDLARDMRQLVLHLAEGSVLEQAAWKLIRSQSRAGLTLVKVRKLLDQIGEASLIIMLEEIARRRSIALT